MTAQPDLKESLLILEKEGNVGIVKLNRPSARNALSSALMKELLRILSELDSDPSIHVMVLTGGEKFFSAGADIKEMSAQKPIEALKEGNLERFDQIPKTTKPIIAAVNGNCLGGGLELAMACDIIVAGESARFGQPETNIGVIPGAGGTQRLTRSVGKYKAMYMILTGDSISSEEALQCGLISKVVPDELCLAEAKRLAQNLASKSTLALSAAKTCVNESYETTLSDGLAFEHKNFYVLMGSEDKEEGMKAFAEKRKPVFKGR
jgi:enoyl-CoA hydratase